MIPNRKTSETISTKMEKQIRKQELYASPEVKVVEMSARQIICVSGNTGGSYFDETEENW